MIAETPPKPSGSTGATDSQPAVVITPNTTVAAKPWYKKTGTLVTTAAVAIVIVLLVIYAHGRV